MAGNRHFISGLPRSGSTLLSALLRQNPLCHAGMSSPVCHLFATLMRAMSQEQPESIFIDDDIRRRVLTGVFDNYYADRLDRQIVFDTNRAWCSRMPALAALWPDSIVIALVRNPAWILDSLERLTRRNALEPSGIFNYSPDGTVYSRADTLMSATGMVGFAMNALREAAFDPHRSNLLLVRFETLTANPLYAMEQIYQAIGERYFEHDPSSIEPDYDAIMFDSRIGSRGLHALGKRVFSPPRETVLPKDLFDRFASAAFWDSSEDIPSSLRVI